jgi:hypothetical protein
MTPSLRRPRGGSFGVTDTPTKPGGRFDRRVELQLLLPVHRHEEAGPGSCPRWLADGTDPRAWGLLIGADHGDGGHQRPDGTFFPLVRADNGKHVPESNEKDNSTSTATITP